MAVLGAARGTTPSAHGRSSWGQLDPSFVRRNQATGGHQQGPLRHPDCSPHPVGHHRAYQVQRRVPALRESCHIGQIDQRACFSTAEQETHMLENLIGDCLAGGFCSVTYTLLRRWQRSSRKSPCPHRC